MTNEIKLTGGRSTDNVIKVDNTVYRPHKKESDFANSVLQFLEKQNFPYSQRFLGRDTIGRDMFEYIDGYVPDEIGETTLEQLIAFMKIIRRFHDISTQFTKCNKVLCHNDLSPCNTVFVNSFPVAIIDWDSCAVGERWEDIDYILWLWINIGSHQRDKINILEQIKTALSAYDADINITKNFADKLIRRMDKVVEEMPSDNYQYARTKDWVAFSKLWVEKNRTKITKEIG